MNSRLILCSMLSLSLTGCASAPLMAADAKPAAPVADPVAVKLPRANPPLFIVFGKTCAISQTGNIESPLLIMLLGSMLKPLIETAVPAATGWLYDKGVHALEAHNAKLQSSSTAVNTTMLYDVVQNKYDFGCVMLVRGVRGIKIDQANYFQRERGGSLQLPAASTWQPDNSAEALKALGISRVPEFYLELALESGSSSTETDGAVLDAMPLLLSKGKARLTTEEKIALGNRLPRSMYRTITPQRFDYLASGAERVSDGTKNVSVEIHFDAMEENGEWKPFYSKTYDFGKLKVGSERVNLASAGTDVFVPPPLRRTPDGYRDPIPVRVTAVLTESEDDTDLGRALETAFRDAQARKSTIDAVAKVVVDKLQEKIDEKAGTAKPTTK